MAGALLGLLAWPAGARAADDAFLQQHGSDVAASAGPGFTIAFAGGRDTYHPGEPIPIAFRFENRFVLAHHDESARGLGLAEAVFDHAEGAGDPQDGIWNTGLPRMSAGVPGCGYSGGNVTFVVDLTQTVRFDRAGTFRFYIRSRHMPGRKGTFDERLISNVLEVHVLDRDPAWERTTLENATRILASETVSTMVQRTAMRDLKVLATDDAVDAMVDLVAPRGTAAWWSVPDLFWRSYWVGGLFAARDRAHVIDRMSGLLDATDRAVSPEFLSTLTILELSRRGVARPFAPAVYRAQLREFARRRLSALDRAGLLREHIRHALSQGDVTEAYPDFVDDVARVFATFPPAKQEEILGGPNNWPRWRDPAFVPWLSRLSAGRQPGGPQDAALRLLHEIAPAEARRLTIRHLRDPRSVMSVEALGLVPDATLPALDDTLAGRLEAAATRTQYRRAIERIERFASARIASRVRAAYQRFPGARGCTLGPPAMAYFFRVDPGFARREIEPVSRAIYEGEDCETAVLQAIAARHFDAEIERVAVAHLRHPIAWLAVDAARTLAEHGSASAEPALWAALERWHARWEPHAAALNVRRERVPWDEALEDELVTAIAEGAGWSLDAAAEQRLISLCVTEDCALSARNAFTHSPRTPTIHVWAPRAAGDEPTFWVHGARSLRLRSRQAFRDWLRQQPAGSRLAWSPGLPSVAPGDTWLWTVEPKIGAEITAWAEAAGLTIEALPGW